MNMNVSTYFISLLFFLLPQLFFAQKGIIVTYEEKQMFSTSIHQLLTDNNFSIYKTISINSSVQNAKEMKKITENLVKNAIYFVKSYKENKILYPAPHVFDSKKQIIFDSLNSIKWKMDISFSATKYLGRKVKMAKCRFRERNYTAWYCPDIPISDGPFKFNGLPGLILKIESDDHIYSFSATKIEFGNNPQLKIHPKYFSNQIQFWTYVKLAKKQMAEDYKQFLSTLPPDQRNIKLDVKTERIEMVF